MDEFAGFLEARGLPQTIRGIAREHIETYIVSLQDAGQRPATVSIAYRSLQPFFRWALEEGEIEVSPMARMKAAARPRDPAAGPAARGAQAPSSMLARARTLSHAVTWRSFGCSLTRACAAANSPDSPRTTSTSGQQVALVMGKGRRPRACPFRQQDRPGPRSISARTSLTRARGS